MTSSIVRKIYPSRRFPAGLSPSGQRSMHHNCMLHDFEKMGEAVGEDVYNDIMNNSSVGIILKLAARKFNFSGATVTHFLSNQLKTARFYEMWSLFGGRPVRFSLNEFEEVTQMNCGEVDANDGWDIDHTQFWEEIGVPVGEGPKWSELLVLFEKIRTWSEEKKRMIALLFILHVGVYGYARDSRIPLKAAKRVMDPEAFERYPWGRVSFQCLISSMQVTDMKKITLHGCVHALLVWIYEAVPILGERFGKRREGGVPMLRWGGGRGRYNLEQVMEEDKKSSNNNKVRIRHLVVKPLEFIYPTWIDAEDFKLNNMIRDILGGCMDEDFWELDAPVSKKKKSKTKADSPGSKKKKNKAKVVEESEDEDDSPVEKKKNRKKSKKMKAKVVVEESEEEDDEDSDEECDLGIQIKNIPKLKKKKETEGGDIAEVLKLLQGMASTIINFDTRLTTLEGKGNVLTAVDEQSNTGDGGDAFVEDDDLSWMEQQPTTKTNLAVSRVVRKPDEKATRTDQRKGKSKFVAPVQKSKQKSKPLTALEKVEAIKKRKRITLKEKETESTADKRRKGAECVEIHDLSKRLTFKEKETESTPVKRKRGADCVEIHDLTKDAIADDGKEKERSDSDFVTPPSRRRMMRYAYSSSSDDEDDIRAEQVNAALTTAFDAITRLSNKDDLEVPPVARNKNLAPSQKSPFIGHSRTVRIMAGTVPSSAVYNPFEAVDGHRLEKLTEYVNQDIDNPFENTLPLVEFYLGIMTPKENWPHSRYGWLNSEQMGAAMDMLRKRAMQRPTPFTSERIAFLDPIFGNLWCQEYKWNFKGKEKTFLFGEGYINMYNGLLPTFSPTHQKWVTDVDTLYIAHNINDVHWVGVVVDLVNMNVKVYDNILSGSQDNLVAESCRPYTKMIPKLLKAAAPPEKRKGMTEASFQFYRKKSNIPQNIQSGDCGVYTVKFLECLALGHTMDGICDATVPAIRLKLAADILEEAPLVDLAIQVSDPNPHTNPDDKVPLQTDSS